MFETFRLLNRFYSRETKGSLLFHKTLTYGHYFVFNSLSLFLPRNFVKHIFRNYVRIGFLPMKVTLKDGIVINHHLEHYGPFFEVILSDEYMLRELRPNSVVVDVGANIGLVSILSSKRFGAKKVISYEPCSDNFRLLKKNVEENHCHNVFLNNVAVSDQEGQIKLHLHGPGTHSINEKRPAKHYETVRMTTLDKSLASERSIDFLKIDVEGAELAVLKGATKTLKKTRRLIMEWTTLCSHEKILEILKKNGFEVDVRDNLLYAKKRH